MPVPGPAAATSAWPRPPLAERLTPAQWLALDAAAAVMVALWVVFHLRLRHGFRVDLPPGWFGALGAAVTLPVAVRRLWPVPVLAVVTAALAVLTTLGRAELGLAVGILLDRFGVRTLLVPSAVVLLGRRNWWPSRLSRRPGGDPGSST